jgi:thymidylate synthase (FAD)
MKVVSPTFEILEELDQQSMATRIESCGRICYKSEDKITESSAEPFIKGIIKHGHNSVTEMAALTLRVTVDNDAIATQFFNTIPKYLIVDHLEKKVLLITGTVRAFRELFKDNPAVKLIKAVSSFLGKKYPLFYYDLVPKTGWLPYEGVDIEKLTLAAVDELSAELLARHRYIGVKFITNRAVTHEIVRHRPCSYLQESQRYCR